VHLINDARAFGVAELRLGAGRGARSIVGLTLGTGVGGVIAVDGRVQLGHDGTAGEVGHQTIDPDGPPCGCGNHGCLEAFARADRIAAACGTATAEAAVEPPRASGPGRVGGAPPRDRVANMITSSRPDRVIIGGGIAPRRPPLEPIRAELRQRVGHRPREVEVTAELDGPGRSGRHARSSWPGRADAGDGRRAGPDDRRRYQPHYRRSSRSCANASRRCGGDASSDTELARVQVSR
jgi:glucokinase